MTLHDTRPVSVTIPRKKTNLEYTYDGFTYSADGSQKVRLRSDSLPEARHLRRLRRELSLDTDLDLYKHNEEPVFPPHVLKSWKNRRVTHKQVNLVRDRKSEVVVISTEPIGPETPRRESAGSPTGGPSNIPWTNWTRWNMTKGKRLAQFGYRRYWRVVKEQKTSFKI